MSAKPESNPEQISKNQAASATPKQTARQRARPAREGEGLRLTDKAAQRVKATLKREGYPDTYYLYVGVKGGGCGGLQYVLDLRDEAQAPVHDTDVVFDSHGIVVVCDLKSYIVGNLSGTTIDYQDGLMESGFTFNNPNAKHSCGCGASFSA